jgi:hypothetical protein
MKTTLGELRGYIWQRLSEVKTHYPQLQVGTKWETGVNFWSPTDGTNDWRCDVPFMVRGQPGNTPSGASIPKGTEVEVVDRVEYDRGQPPRHYNGYTSPAQPDITETPVIEWQGQRYAVFGASPSDFIKPDAGFQAGYTWNEAIVYAMAQLNRSMTPKEILAAAAELKGLGGQANSGLYIKNAVYKGLVKFDGKQGRSSFYALTDEGRALAAELEEEEERENPRPPPTVIRRNREPEGQP